MAREKPLSRYPREYRGLFRRGACDITTLVAPDIPTAKKWRNELYAFRRVYRRDGPDDELQLVIDMVVVRRRGTHIIFEPQVNTGLAGEIVGAMNDDL